MATIQIDTALLMALDPDVLGRILADEIMNCHGDKERRLGAWFMNLKEDEIVKFFAATSDQPTKPAVSKAKPKAKAKSVSKLKAYTPYQATTRKKSKPKPKAKAAAKATPAGYAKDSFAQPGPRTPTAKLAKAIQPDLFDGEGGDDEDEEDLPVSKAATAAAIGDDRHRLIDYLRRYPKAGAQSIQAALSMTGGQVKGLLKRLREQGAVIVEGKNRGAKYSAS